MYINGKAPVLDQGGRGINKNVAMAGHDYFEVAFLHPDTGTIARATWGLRDSAGITGIHRTAGGIDYRFVSAEDVSSSDQGAAILFVGKKSDKTLLAIGRLNDVDNGSGLTGTTLITNETVSITFKVDALNTGVVKIGDVNNTAAIAESSFLTASTSGDQTAVTAANTLVVPFRIGTIWFPMYKLTENSPAMYAEYRLRISSDIGIGAASPGFDEYAKGLILAKDIDPLLEGGGLYAKKQPRYPLQGTDDFQGYSLRLDHRTEITPLNNLAALASFQNPVRMSFNTESTENGSAFSLIFEIPVYPLSADNSSVNNIRPGMWFVRPSYDSYLLDIDDGRGGTGGAVLIGTGIIESPSGIRIRVVIPPNKYLYGNGPSDSPSGTIAVDGRDFDIRGLVVYLEYADGTFIRELAHDELTFVVGGGEKLPGKPSEGPGTPPYPSGVGYFPNTDLGPSGTRLGYLNDQLYGIQTVLVNYRDPSNGTLHTDAFPIICNNTSGSPNWASIPDDHIIVITPRTYQDNNVATQIHNMIQDPITGGSGTYVIVAPASFNFQTVTLQETYEYLFIIVAGTLTTEADANTDILTMNNIQGAPSQTIMIGKGSTNINDADAGNGIGEAFVGWSARSSFYFGRWPFNTPLTVTINSWPRTQNFRPPRGIYTTYPYVLNAGGPVAQINLGPPLSVGEPPFPPNNNTGSNGAPSPPPNPNYFLRDGHGGRMYRVTVDDGYATILNYNYLR